MPNLKPGQKLKTSKFLPKGGGGLATKAVKRAQFRGILLKLIDAAREEYDAINTEPDEEWNRAREHLKSVTDEALKFFEETLGG